MHTQLLNIGFTKVGDNIYFNQEIGITVELTDDKDTVIVHVPKTGKQLATIEELEEAMISGSLGEF